MNITCNRDLLNMEVFSLESNEVSRLYEEMQSNAESAGFHKTRREHGTIAVTIANLFGVDMLKALETDYTNNRGRLTSESFERMIEKKPELKEHIYKDSLPTLSELMDSVYNLCSYSTNGDAESRFKFDMDIFRNSYRSVGSFKKGDLVLLAPHWSGHYWSGVSGEGDSINPGSLIRITNIKDSINNSIEVEIETVIAYRAITHSMGPSTFREVRGKFVITDNIDKLPRAALISDITKPSDVEFDVSNPIKAGVVDSDLTQEQAVLLLSMVPNVEMAIYEYEGKPSYYISSKLSVKGNPVVKIINPSKRSITQKVNIDDYGANVTVADLYSIAKENVDQYPYSAYKVRQFSEKDIDYKASELIKIILTLDTTKPYLSVAPYTANDKLTHFLEFLTEEEMNELVALVDGKEEFKSKVLEISVRIANEVNEENKRSRASTNNVRTTTVSSRPRGSSIFGN